MDVYAISLQKCMKILRGDEMNITVIGVGNSVLAMAAHLSKEGECVTLWNRTRATISNLMETQIIHCEGIVQGSIKLHLVTDDIRAAIENPDVILITTPANSHKEIAELIANNVTKETLILLNPGRTFGALEFQEIYRACNSGLNQTIAEAQTNIYVSRKTGEDSFNIIALKNGVLVAAVDYNENENLIGRLPLCLQRYIVQLNQ
jgi:opine dehydrogenase